MAVRSRMLPLSRWLPVFRDGDVGLDWRCSTTLPLAAFQEKPAYRTWLRWYAWACATSQPATVQPAAGRTCRTAVVLLFFWPERSVVIRTTTAFRPPEIGRASCRERVETWGVEESLE